MSGTRPASAAPDRADAVEDVGQVLLRVGDLERVDVGAGADRVRDLRAAVALALLALLEGEVEPHRRQVDEDVREEDGRVEAELVDGRRRHLGDELRRAAQLEEADLLADGAVARLVAAGLAHHPDGDAVDGLLAASRDETVGHGGRILVQGLVPTTVACAESMLPIKFERTGRRPPAHPRERAPCGRPNRSSVAGAEPH